MGSKKKNYKVTVPGYSMSKVWYKYAYSEDQAKSFVARDIGIEKEMSTSWAWHSYVYYVSEEIRSSLPKQSKAKTRSYKQVPYNESDAQCDLFTEHILPAHD